MKKHLSTIVLLSGLALTGCKNNGSPLAPQNPVFNTKDFTSIKENSLEYFALSTYNLVLNLEGTYQIEVDTMPKLLSSDVLVYTSKDANIATVSSSGLVTGVSSGVTEIEVKTSDGKRSDTMNVFVGSTTNKAASLAYLDNAYAYQTANPDKLANKVWAHEFAHQTLYKNGVSYNEQRFVEDIYWSAEDAYFEVSSDDLYLKTENGAVSADHGKWKFFVDKNSYVSFLCHETSSAKNYMEASTQSYIGQDAYQILFDILDMFFVSGRGIVTGYIDDINGKEAFDPTGFIYDIIYKNYDNVSMKLLSAGEKALSINSKVTFEGEQISSSDEFDLEIPAGTEYDASQIENIIINDKTVAGLYYENEMVFKDYNGGGVTRTFSKDVRLSSKFEVKIPDLQTYNKVDSIYDL